MKQLEAMGELENTYVIFTSDHGIAVGRHGLMGKQNLYEHSWRVPYLVAGPGIKPGLSADGNIYLLDTLATICDLAGIEPPETNEGVSYKPALFGEKPVVREMEAVSFAEMERLDDPYRFDEGYINQKAAPRKKPGKKKEASQK